MPCCPRSVDATWRRTNLRSSLPSSIAPAKLAVCALSLFCPPTSKGHIFSTAWPIRVNFMSNERVFRALRRNRAILEEWTKKRGGLSSSCGAFSGLKLQNGTARNMGYGAPTERDSYAMLSSFGRCYMAKNESPFKFTSSIAPGKVGCLCCFRCFALQLQKAISFQPLGRFG